MILLFGTLDAQRLLIWTAAAAAVVMIVRPSLTDAPLASTIRGGLALAAIALAASAAATVGPVPPDLIAYGRQLATFRGVRYLYQGIAHDGRRWRPT